jgi:hypothetical protein
MANDRADDERRAMERRRGPSARELSLRSELISIRHDLRGLLAELDRLAAQPVSPVQSAVVTAVVPKTVLMHHNSTRRG